MFCLHCSNPLPASCKKYCSRDCQNTAFSLLYRKRNQELYDRHPSYCKNCNTQLPYEKRKSQFCGHSCAASYNNFGRERSEESRVKTSITLLKLSENMQRGTSFGSATVLCQNCRKSFTYNKARSKGLYCSVDCAAISKWKKTKDKIEEGYIASHETMRKYLIEKNSVCAHCGLGEIWNGKPIALHMDHKDGNSDNNKLDNLHLLCPNCHSQTETWCARNKKNTKRSKYARQWRKTIAVGLEPDGKAGVLHTSMTEFDSPQSYQSTYSSSGA